MFTTVIDNATSWIDSALKKNQVPLPEIVIEETVVNETTDVDETTDETEETEDVQNTSSNAGVNIVDTHIEYNLINVPSGLRTASIYHSASDILLSLYHGDELPVQYDVWFNKAQQLLQDYIDAYWNEDADESDKVGHQTVKHSKGLTYNQKRHRRGIRL